MALVTLYFIEPLGENVIATGISAYSAKKALSYFLMLMTSSTAYSFTSHSTRNASSSAAEYSGVSGISRSCPV